MTPAEDMRVAGIAPDPDGISRHGYPAAAMATDYLRAAAGLVPTAALLTAVPVSTAAAVILGGFALLFGAFGARTALRQGTRLEMSDAELRAHGGSRAVIRWAEIDRLRLSYYSTRRDRRSGWMQLDLGAGRQRLKLDSRLDGFDRVVRRAAEAADARELELDEPTVANLQSFGIRFPGERRPW